MEQKQLLQQIEDDNQCNETMNSLLERTQTEEAGIAIRVGYVLADLILFHGKVRKNGEQMLAPW